MPNSSEVTAGVDTVRAVQYNNLRDDILDVSAGHGHSGSGEDGKQLDGADALVAESVTPTQIANRTRTIMLPWSGSYRSDSPEYMGGYTDVRGANMHSLYETSYAWTGWMVPVDFVSSLTATVIINSSGPDETYMLSFLARYGGMDEHCRSHTESFSGTWTDTGTNAYHVEGPSHTLADASIGDIVRFQFTRDANSSLDTGAYFIQTPGILISYTSDA